MRYSALLLVCGLILPSSSIAADKFVAVIPGQAPASPATTDSLRVAADISFLAKLSTPIKLSQAKSDDTVEAQTTQDIKQGHDVLLKKGSTLVGHVYSVQSPTAGKPDYYVVVVFDRVTPKGGRQMQFNLTIQAIAPESDMDSSRDIADSTGTGLQGTTRAAQVSGHEGGTKGAINQINATSKGVYDFQGLQLGDRLVDGKHYSVLVSSQKEFQLKKGTQLVMKVVAQ